MNKIKDKQLEAILKQQTELQKIINEIGVLETQKHGLLHQIATINQAVEATKQELEKEYGVVNINLETGEYVDIPKTEPVEAVV
tara:strand:- start:331 stop:582 length:252 start_codon:yes stop_codon:yes gene_type:complete